MSAIAKREPGYLAILADEIRSECVAIEADFESGVDRAAGVGDRLIKAKAQCGHGEWTPWIEENFPYSPQVARAWMRLAEAKRIPGFVLGDTVKGALAKVAAPNRQRVNADSEPAEDEGDAVSGEPVEESRPIPEVLFDPKKGGVVEAEIEEEDNEYPRPAEPNEIGFVIDQMRLLVSELELYDGMENMAETVNDWIENLEREISANE